MSDILRGGVSTPYIRAQPDMFNPKSFFTPTNKLIYFTDDRSVRPTDGQIIVNVDVTIGVVLPGNLNLEKLCAEYLGIETRRLDSFIPKLRLFLKGVKVVIDLPGHTNKRPKVIKDIIAKVDEFTFDKGGERITVASHFALAHRYTVRRGSLGVKLGSAGVFPMNSRASPEVVREALEFSPRDPNQRLQAIKAGWQELQYTTSYFLRGAGITINPEPISVHGRLLTSPLILFGNERLSLQRPGTWDVMRKRLNQPARLQRWVIVNFANADRSLLQKFIDDLMKCMGERGMSKKYRAEMMLVILPESALGIYREVKSFGDILQGVATQCVKWSRKLSNDARDGRANQYMNNLILKINAKLGGINFVPSSDAMKFLGNGEPTMVIGADVSHPAPGSLLPSVSALVSSRDETFSKYVASIRVQEHRTEIIQDFAEMFTIATYAFISRNKKPPKRIFIFRDGVSEGEFTNVLDQEVQAMQSTFTELYKESPWPKITFIVVGKRHHFRFFGEPKSESVDPKGNGNLYSGFVTDRVVTVVAKLPPKMSSTLITWTSIFNLSQG
ncbi:hypothetical protein H0H93_005479 [Arthromyces matolae]|nr:hypothetical protein H0H93_005479 [Arthromyces matolae]